MEGKSLAVATIISWIRSLIIEQSRLRWKSRPLSTVDKSISHRQRNFNIVIGSLALFEVWTTEAVEMNILGLNKTTSTLTSTPYAGWISSYYFFCLFWPTQYKFISVVKITNTQNISPVFDFLNWPLDYFHSWNTCWRSSRFSNCDRKWRQRTQRTKWWFGRKCQGTWLYGNLIN